MRDQQATAFPAIQGDVSSHRYRPDVETQNNNLLPKSRKQTISNRMVSAVPNRTKQELTGIPFARRNSLSVPVRDYVASFLIFHMLFEDADKSDPLSEFDDTAEEQ